MKERKPIWRSIVVWIIILGVLGVISFFVISNLVGQQYNSISTSQFESQLYEVNDSLVEDKNDFIIYSYSTVEDNNKVDVKTNVAIKNSMDLTVRNFIKFLQHMIIIMEKIRFGQQVMQMVVYQSTKH